MVYFRRQLFRKKFNSVINTRLSRQVTEKLNTPVRAKVVSWWKRIFSFFTRRPLSQDLDYEERSGTTTPPRVRTDMIRRVGSALKPVNPSGWISRMPPPSPNEGPGLRSTLNGQNGYHPPDKEAMSHERKLFIETKKEGLVAFHTSNHQRSHSSSSDNQWNSTSSNGSNTSTDNAPSPLQGRLPQRTITLTIPQTPIVDFAVLPRRSPALTEQNREDGLSYRQGMSYARSIERVPTQNQDRRKSFGHIPLSS